MARDDIPVPERVLELGPGMAIYRVHVDRLRERDMNARIMAPDKFDRLIENIRGEGALESLPLASLLPEDPGYLALISGHHRARAARAAEIMVIFCLVIERELTYDELSAKQLAHNALNGHDDLDVLRALYESIETPQAKLESGLTEMDLGLSMPAWGSDSIDVEFDFEPVYILWMSANLTQFEHLLDRLDPEARVYAANHADFDQFIGSVRKVSRLRNVRNIAGIMVAMMEYAEAGMAAEIAAKEQTA